MEAQPESSSHRGLWRLMTLLAFGIVAYSVVLIAVPALRPPFLRERIATVPWAVYTHLGASAIALGLGPFQFDAAARARRLRLHRWLGRAYLVGVLAGGASGFVLAQIAQGGLVAHIGFGALAAVWISTAALAYRSIRAGRRAEHRKWMIRNYALTFAAVTLRIYLPASVALGAPFALTYPAISWLCWVPNLWLAERWIVRKPV